MAAHLSSSCFRYLTHQLDQNVKLTRLYRWYNLPDDLIITLLQRFSPHKIITHPPSCHKLEALGLTRCDAIALASDLEVIFYADPRLPAVDALGLIPLIRSELERAGITVFQIETLLAAGLNGKNCSHLDSRALKQFPDLFTKPERKTVAHIIQNLGVPIQFP